MRDNLYQTQEIFLDAPKRRRLPFGMPRFSAARHRPFLLVLALIVTGVLRAADATVATIEQESTWRRQMREALRIADPLPALDPKTHARLEVAPDVVIERVTYGTQFGM